MSLWSDIRRYASSWLEGGSKATESAEDAAFCRQWLVDHGQSIVHNFARAAVIPELLGAVISMLINPPPFDWLGGLLLAALAMRCTLWIIFEKRIRKDRMHLALRFYSLTSTVIVAGAVTSYVYEALFNPDYSPGIVLVAGMVWGSAAWIIGLGTPVLGLSSMISTMVVSVVTVAILYAANAPGFAKFGWLFVVIDLTIAGFLRQKFEQLKAHALLHKRTAELENQLRFFALNAVDHELRTAASVQSTLAHTVDQIKVDGLELRLFNEPYGALGGDILLTRQNRDGSLVLAVGDVTGKGAPAAMVVQAVLSLWTVQDDEKEFLVKPWLDLVNSTLLRMGREPGLNTMTMGVLVINRHQAEYYRAGHLPLYVQRRAQGSTRVDAISGQGMPLGIMEDPGIQPVAVDLHAAGGCTFWLGTDGIFDWGTRRSSRLLQLLERIEREGKVAVKSHPVEDDKILVALQYEEVA